jgi:glycosyltransferase involved in cell wall biosynthesis
MRSAASLCVIVKNNPQVGVLLRLARDFFEEIVVVDTGSTDTTTVAIAQSIANRFEVFTDCNGPDGRIVNFSLARKRSFDLATQPILVWADSDDEPRFENLEDEIAALHALRAQLGKPVLLQYPYRYSENAAGATVIHNRERLLLQQDWLDGVFEWRGRVHELLTGEEDSIARVRRPASAMVWTHRQQAHGRESDRDLRILRLSLEEEGGFKQASLRTLYCLAGELVARKLWDEARHACVAYLDRPGATAERSLLLVYLARIAQHEERYETALQFALAAFGNTQGDGPDAAKDAAFAVADVYRSLAKTDDVDRSLHANRCAVQFFRLGLGMKDNEQASSFPQAAFAARLGLIDALRALDKEDEALLAVEEALQLAPGAPQFLKHRGELNISTQKKALVKSVAHLHDWGQLSFEDCQNLSKILNTAPNVGTTQTDPAPPVVCSGKLDIILACGDTRETWNPDLVEAKGIGGSETAACDWARGMVERGHRVRVYTRCGEAKMYDGVEYLPTASLDGSSANVLIAWRFPQLLHRAKAPVELVWAHDTTIPGALPGTHVVALSEWHKKTLLEAHPGIRVDIIQGAIRIKDFICKIERRPRAAICMSAHERHLMAFVDIWPRIREKVPTATLDLCYGYDEWRQLPTNRVFAAQIAYFDRKRPMLESLGVKFYPRMTPKEIAQKMLSSSVWLYPTSWPETWCAAAAQAQAAGLFGVTSNLAALPEICDDHVALIDGGSLDPRYQEAFVSSAVVAFRRQMTRSEPVATKFGWSRCLNQWEELLLAATTQRG